MLLPHAHACASAFLCGATAHTSVSFPLRPHSQDGLYLDGRTQRLRAQLVSYNPELRLFSSALITFHFSPGGSVQVPWGVGMAWRTMYLPPCTISLHSWGIAHRTSLPSRLIPAPLPHPQQVAHKIQTLRVELYATPLDMFRLVLEVVLTLCVCAMALSELRGLARVGCVWLQAVALLFA